LIDSLHNMFMAGLRLQRGWLLELLSRRHDALLALATRLAEAKTMAGHEVRALLAQEMNAATTGPKGPAP
jgi:hypothetical protein